MRKFIFLLVAFALSACATIQNPLNVTKLAQIESAYGIALAAAVGYYELYKVNRCTVLRPESPTNFCARRSVVVKLQAADRKAFIAMHAARVFVHNNPNLDASSYISAASLAIGAMRQVEELNGVR